VKIVDSKSPRGTRWLIDGKRNNNIPHTLDRPHKQFSFARLFGSVTSPRAPILFGVSAHGIQGQSIPEWRQPQEQACSV
jgi:hypothetical protein